MAKKVEFLNNLNSEVVSASFRYQNEAEILMQVQIMNKMFILRLTRLGTNRPSPGKVLSFLAYHQ